MKKNKIIGYGAMLIFFIGWMGLFRWACFWYKKEHIYQQTIIPLIIVMAIGFGLAFWKEVNEFIVLVTILLVLTGTFTQSFLIEHKAIRQEALKYVMYGLWQVGNEIPEEKDGETKYYATLNEYLKDTALDENNYSQLEKDIGKEEAAGLVKRLMDYGVSFTYTPRVKKEDLTEEELKIYDARKKYLKDQMAEWKLEEPSDYLYEKANLLYPFPESEEDVILDEVISYRKWDFAKLFPVTEKNVVKRRAGEIFVPYTEDRIQTKKQYRFWDLLGLFPETVEQEDTYIGFFERNVDKRVRITSDDVQKALVYFRMMDRFDGYKELLNQEMRIRELGVKGYEGETALRIRRNIIFGFACMFLFLIFFWNFRGICTDFVVFRLMLLDILMFPFMKLIATGDDGTSITVAGIQPLELLKIAYVFILAGLLCKDEAFTIYGVRPDITGKKLKKLRKKSTWLKLFRRSEWERHIVSFRIPVRMSREIIAFCFIGINFIGCAVLSEFGTGLSLTFSGLFVLIVLGRHRWDAFDEIMRYIRGIFGSLVGKVCVLIVILGCIRFWDGISSRFEKVYGRFYAWRHAAEESLRLTTGYQYMRIKYSLALSQPFSVDKERYKVVIPEQDTDIIFAKFVQIFGYIMGLALIAVYILLIFLCYRVAMRQKERYLRGLVLTSVSVIAFQTFLHILYNVELFAITGVPLMFISKGGTNLAVSLCLVGIVLMVSSGNMLFDISKEKKYYETPFGRKYAALGITWPLLLITISGIAGIVIYMGTH